MIQKGSIRASVFDRFTDKPLILTFASAGAKDSYSVAVPYNLYTMKTHDETISMNEKSG